jgi:NAD(P)-dependent dehydrogenase (short-subunit alcohol dehydrogenase family)
VATVSVVTGANSGIGRATAIHLAAKGHQVYGTVRDPERAGKMQRMAGEAGVEVRLVQLDVADDDSVHDGLAQVLEREGKVDVLVNNAGIAPNAVVEEATPSSMLETFDVNVCGAVRCLREVLPGMRERRSGAIVNITSVAGRFASIAQAPYVASKWAFEGLSEELAFELAPFGIRVAIIEPGVTRSAIFAKGVDVPEPVGGYDLHYRRMFDFYAAGLTHASDPFEVAEVVHHAVTTDSPRLRYPCAWGGPEIVAGRSRMSDEGWVALGAVTDDDEYEARFREFFSIEARPPA